MRYGSLWALVGALLAGCNSTPLSTSADSGGQAAGAVAPGQSLGGLPLPPGSTIRADQSLIIGAGDTWVGRASLDAGRDADAIYRFFLDNLTAQGWTVLTAVRSRQSLLVLTRQERTLTVEISEPVLGSPSVYLTAAPRNAPVMAPRKP